MESLRDARTLPASWYTDARIFALESSAIFHHAWQYAGLCEDLTRHGDFITCRAGRVPIVVVRDENEIRAFINVCRHRGSELVLQERGNRKSIQCHYHAWTYGLDGSLRAAPGEKLEPDFDRSDYHLLPAQVGMWGPLVFVNPDLGAPPLDHLLGVLPDLVRETGLRLDDLRSRKGVTYDIAANWKVVVDNFLECYHCPVAHPGFASVIDLDTYTVQEYEFFSVQTGGGRESARRTHQYDAHGEVRDGFYAYLWPNFTLNIYPGPGNVSLNLFEPIDESHTRATFEYLFVDEVDDAAVEEFSRFIDQVQREDSVLCESVQRGLASGYFQQGRLMVSRESALRHFQSLVCQALDGHRSPSAPGACDLNPGRSDYPVDGRV
jgi:choline monooxygenase